MTPGVGADAGTTVCVAPREIHDLAYRAGRVAGCDPGTAERIAENVTLAEIRHGAAVRAFCETLGAADLATSAWATAPDAVLAAEVAARADGAALAVFDPAVPLACIAAVLHQSLQRGVAAVGIDSGARGDEMLAVVEMCTVAPERAAPSGELIAEARRDAHRLGVRVDAVGFGVLEAAAAGFLVVEATLDEIES